MRLPKLRVIQDEVRQPVHCSQHDYCSECALFVKNNGRCEGCTPLHRKEMSEEFQWCYQECHSCTGYKAVVTAVCCRSPLKKMYLDAVTRNPDDWNQPQFRYTQRQPISSPNKAVFFFSQTCNAKNVVGKALRKHEMVATNLKVVVKPNGKGFKSNDLHDYLNLDKQTKLILTSMDIDSHLEAAWEQSLYEKPELFEKVGLSYWMPLAFTTRGDADARMHQYYQFCRTYLTMERMQAHFVPGYYQGAGFRLQDLILAAVEKIPNVIFNAQFLGTKDSANTRATLLTIKRWHEFIPAHVPFWIVGASTPFVFHNVRKIVGARDVYWISGKPLYMSLYGQEMRVDGNERDLGPDEHVSRPKLVRRNYAKFKELVERWDVGAKV